jgi:SAM-dependent methyltransferase
MVAAKQFYPGAIDYSGGMSAGYNSGRALSSEAAAIWTAIVAPFVRQGTNTRILDLGAGTGRFAELFARTFEAQVIGVEPSTAMLEAALRRRYLCAMTAATSHGCPRCGITFAIIRPVRVSCSEFFRLKATFL